MSLDQLLATIIADWEEQKRFQWQQQGLMRANLFEPNRFDQLIAQDHFDAILPISVLERNWADRYHGGGLLIQIALHGLPREELRALHAQYLIDAPADMKLELCGNTRFLYGQYLRGARLWIMARVSQYNANKAGQLTLRLREIDSLHKSDGAVMADLEGQLAGVKGFAELARDLEQH